MHDALRWFLDPGLVRHFADIADHPRAVGAERAKKIERQRSEFLKDAWPRAAALFRVVKAAYAARLRQVPASPHPSTSPATCSAQAQAFNTRFARGHAHAGRGSALPGSVDRCRAPRAAQPQSATHGNRDVGPGARLVRAPVARRIHRYLLQPERTALDLFDRLRLREPFGHAFTALGFQGEEAWRVAARIKVLLLAGADSAKPQGTVVSEDGDGKSAASGAPEPALSLPKGLASETCEVKTPPASAPGLDDEKREGKTAPTTSQPEQEQVALSPVLWLDPDVRWLCGVHEAEGHFYLVSERYEELLWWLLMPALLRLAGEAAPSRAAVEALSKTVAAALHSAEAVGYRVNSLLGPLAAAGAAESPAPEPEPGDASPTAPGPEA